MTYRPRMSPERADQMRRWHGDASAELRERGDGDVEYLGLRRLSLLAVLPVCLPALGRSIPLIANPDTAQRRFLLELVSKDLGYPLGAAAVAGVDASSGGELALAGSGVDSGVGDRDITAPSEPREFIRCPTARVWASW
jgi:hypothetical protein